MLAMANAKERDRNDWVDLFASIDPRFKVQNIVTPEKSQLSIVEVVWDGQEAADHSDRQQSSEPVTSGELPSHVSTANGQSNGLGDGQNGVVHAADGAKPQPGCNGAIPAAVNGHSTGTNGHSALSNGETHVESSS